MEKINKISILDNEKPSQRKIKEESQPSILSFTKLLNEGLNEHDILMVLDI